VKKTLIVSDVHLKVALEDRPRHAAFIDFLRHFRPPEYDRIVCLGDLFDFWFEYKRVIFSDYFAVLRALADARDAGMEIHLVCGNHDFWAGRFLHDDLGIQIHDRLELDFGGRRALFVHGDGINPTDRAYRVYKRIARNPLVVRLFSLIHPDWAMRIAQGVSHGSRSLFERPDPADGPEARSLANFARRTLEAGEADVVLCGHAHAPTRQEFPARHGTGLYLNTGDWLQHRSYVTWDGSDFTLSEWPKLTKD